MKITYHPNQDIFESQAEALVNPVNCVGVMGAGLAEEFKQRFPEMYRYYKTECFNRRLGPGKCQPCSLPAETGHRFAINFPTKYHWREDSELWMIEDGLRHLRDIVQTRAIKSIAIPMLGCGFGGLKWDIVRPYITEALKDLDCTVEIYGPGPEEHPQDRHAHDGEQLWSGRS